MIFEIHAAPATTATHDHNKHRYEKFRRASRVMTARQADANSMAPLATRAPAAAIWPEEDLEPGWGAIPAAPRYYDRIIF